MFASAAAQPLGPEHMTSFSNDFSSAPLPRHLRSDGPFPALLEQPPTGYPTREQFDRFQSMTRREDRLLSPSHIDAIHAWVEQQPVDRPNTELTRATEMQIYLAQVAAAALANGNTASLTHLVRTAMVMGAWIVAAQETAWRNLLPARQLADAFSDRPGAEMRAAAAAAGPAFEAALDHHWPSVQRLPELALVRHEPTGQPILERPWDAGLNASQVKYGLRRLEQPASTSSFAWQPQGELYLQTSVRHDESPIRTINRFLQTGRRGDELATVVDTDPSLAAIVAWSHAYWQPSASTLPDPELPDELALVSRAGAPCFARRLRPAGLKSTS